MNDFKAFVRTDLGITRPINILKSVKQDDILSVMLVCIVISEITLETDDEICPSSYQIGGHLILNHQTT